MMGRTERTIIQRTIEANSTLAVFLRFPQYVEDAAADQRRVE